MRRGERCLNIARRVLERAQNEGLDFTLVNARFVKPLDEGLLSSLKAHTVITIEDNVLIGGLGDSVARFYRGSGKEVVSFGYPDVFIPARSAIRSHAGVRARRRAHFCLREGEICVPIKYFFRAFRFRTKAAEALKQGLVLRDGRLLSPDSEVNEGDAFEFLSPEEQFVSNGGYKLARGLDVFQEDVSGKAYCDLGASTGGFTDCLLQRGAKSVVCVDVGESLLAPSLASDPRVVVMDNTNARYLKKEDLPFPVDGVVSDLSFISLSLVCLPSEIFCPKAARRSSSSNRSSSAEGRGFKSAAFFPFPAMRRF